jgi:uroporphyrinogen-III decarboxylase
MQGNLWRHRLASEACPSSLMATGTPEDVKAYCKKLIDVVGKDGGYIMDASAALDDAKVENVKMLFEFTKDYGIY